MSQENVEVVRQAWEASERHDATSALALYDPEIEIDLTAVPRLGQPSIYRGVEGVQRFFRSWLTDIEGVRTEVKEWIDAGEHVIAMVHAYGKGRRSGVPVDMVQAHLWTVRDGKLLRLRILATRQQALEAAGLEEQAMSEENVEVARRVLDAFNRADRDQQRLLEGFRASYLHFAEAFNRRDFEAAFAPIPPDLVFNTVVAERAEALAGELRELHGREELIAFFHDWVEEFPDWRLDVERFANPTPGVIFVTSTVHGTGRSSGVPVVRRFTEVWDMRSRPIRVSQHQDEDDALKAAGLSE